METTKLLAKHIVSSPYQQVCVWQGVVVEVNQRSEFVEWMSETFQLKHPVYFIKTLVTSPTPGEPETGGREDVLFYIHNDDIASFAVPRLQYGIRWIEDVIDNGGQQIHRENLSVYYSWTW